MHSAATLIYSILRQANLFSLAVGPVSKLICLLIQSGSLVVAGSYASQVGLVIITVERYYRVVHPLKHRIHFKSWMVKAGLILPWINTLVVCIIPMWSTTRLLGPGYCASFYAWPTHVYSIVYTVLIVIWQALIPVCIFVYCYTMMMMAIRRQASKIASSSSSSAPVAAAANGSAR